MSDVRIVTLRSPLTAETRTQLSEILIDCVRDGASIGFLDPLDPGDANAYWQRIDRAIGERRCVLLAAVDDENHLVGTAQLDIDTLPNQPHRATVSKVLVHTTARRRGIGEALMLALDRAAIDNGRWLLTLDTATDAAERLYQRLGWTVAGAIPNYAMNPDRSLTPTVYYWKELPRERISDR